MSAEKAMFKRFDDRELVLVGEIMARAWVLYCQQGIECHPQEVYLDLAAVSVHTPLRLADLLAADNFNFMHDIRGINRNLCPDTGRWLNHFRPRFPPPDVAAVDGGS